MTRARVEIIVCGLLILVTGSIVAPREDLWWFGWAHGGPLGLLCHHAWTSTSKPPKEF